MHYVVIHEDATMSVENYETHYNNETMPTRETIIHDSPARVAPVVFGMCALMGVRSYGGIEVLTPSQFEAKFDAAVKRYNDAVAEREADARSDEIAADGV